MGALPPGCGTGARPGAARRRDGVHVALSRARAGLAVRGRPFSAFDERAPDSRARSCSRNASSRRVDHVGVGLRGRQGRRVGVRGGGCGRGRSEVELGEAGDVGELVPVARVLVSSGLALRSTERERGRTSCECTRARADGRATAGRRRSGGRSGRGRPGHRGPGGSRGGRRLGARVRAWGPAGARRGRLEGAPGRVRGRRTTTRRGGRGGRARGRGLRTGPCRVGMEQLVVLAVQQPCSAATSGSFGGRSGRERERGHRLGPRPLPPQLRATWSASRPTLSSPQRPLAPAPSRPRAAPPRRTFSSPALHFPAPEVTASLAAPRNGPDSRHERHLSVRASPPRRRSALCRRLAPLPLSLAVALLGS